MSEAPNDDAVDSTLNVHDELDTPEECPAVRLEPLHRDDAPTLLEDDLDVTVKLPTIWHQRIRLQSPGTPALPQDELDITAKLPAIWLQPTRPLALQPPDIPAVRAARPIKIKSLLYEWLKTNSVMLINAGSLVCTTVVTGVLGFAYWWIAARQFPPQAVGLASAAVSAMMLLGAICILGLGTLLIGELPRHPGKEASLISAALIVVGGTGACGGIFFALVAPLISADFQPFRASIGAILLFAVGVSLTTITVVLDQAFIGLLKGTLGFWRNTLASVAKLVALILAGLGLMKVGETIYGTWALGNVLSLVPLAGIAVLYASRSRKSLLPDWQLLRKLRLPALEHHMLNLILQAPTTALPLLVTILLSATANAWFYVAWMISGLVSIAAYALTTVLYAINADQSAELARKTRITLGLALVTSIVANCLLMFGATQILGLFGHDYAEQAAWCLRILGLGAFPMIIYDHYIAVCRIHRKIARVAPFVALGCLFELGMAAWGGHLGGLVGLSLGWDAALCVEAVFMFPAVYRAAFPKYITLEASEAGSGSRAQ